MPGPWRASWPCGWPHLRADDLGDAAAAEAPLAMALAELDDPPRPGPWPRASWPPCTLASPRRPPTRPPAEDARVVARLTDGTPDAGDPSESMDSDSTGSDDADLAGPPRLLSQPPADPGLARLWGGGDRAGLAEALGLRAARATGGVRAELLARQGVVLAERPETLADAARAFRGALDEAEAPSTRCSWPCRCWPGPGPRAGSPICSPMWRGGWSSPPIGARALGCSPCAGRCGWTGRGMSTARGPTSRRPPARCPGRPWRPSASGPSRRTQQRGGPPSRGCKPPCTPARERRPPEHGSEATAFRRVVEALGALGRSDDVPATARGILDANPACLPALAVLTPTSRRRAATPSWPRGSIWP
ncbi:MAG: hypothetical protein R3F43_17985 [bacterium]